MKFRKAEVHRRVHHLPRVVFSGSRLTTYAGLVLFAALFSRLRLAARLRGCFRKVDSGRAYGLSKVFLLLVVHILLGFRRLRDIDYYREDPIVLRTVGLAQLPNVSTVSRSLAAASDEEVARCRALNRELVLDRLEAECCDVVTMDFDGSVIGTNAHAEGSAVGFNKKKKGQRSYYPLFATIAQTDQFFDELHRPGNVYDSNGASEFAAACFAHVSSALPKITLKTRFDSAFFNEKMIDVLDAADVRFTCSVAFLRHPKLKGKVRDRERWRHINKDISYFECRYKPKSWSRNQVRLVFVRKRVAVQKKGPFQLDLYEPTTREFTYSVSATNHRTDAKSVILFHNGRGSQEKMFGQAKTYAALDMLVSKRLIPNKLFSLAGMFAHNLGRELQMGTKKPRSCDGSKRPVQWTFQSLRTLRQRLLHRAGLVKRPAGLLTLELNDNERVHKEMNQYLDRL